MREPLLRLLSDCAHHDCCPQQVDLPLPARVIDVENLSIVTTGGQRGRFAALSYCWGQSTQTLLLTSTLAKMSHHIDIDTLPQSIQDAILVVRSISIKYLWV
jgi:hypothetical protein